MSLFLGRYATAEHVLLAILKYSYITFTYKIQSDQILEYRLKVCNILFSLHVGKQIDPQHWLSIQDLDLQVLDVASRVMRYTSASQCSIVPYFTHRHQQESPRLVSGYPSQDSKSRSPETSTSLTKILLYLCIQCSFLHVSPCNLF